MRTTVCICLLVIGFLSCKKSNTTPGNSIEIYPLKSYQTISGRCQVDPASATLENQPLVRNEDITAYSISSYQFTLNNAAISAIKNTNAAAFAVTVDRQVIYYVFFKPYYSSSSCEHSITMDFDYNNQLFMRLGYPDFPQSTLIDDQRNNPLLVATLRAQGKLQ